jgi:hypothetical protein
VTRFVSKGAHVKEKATSRLGGPDADESLGAPKRAHERRVREALASLDGSPESAVALLSGLAMDRIAGLGGFG